MFEQLVDVTVPQVFGESLARRSRFFRSECNNRPSVDNTGDVLCPQVVEHVVEVVQSAFLSVFELMDQAEFVECLACRLFVFSEMARADFVRGMSVRKLLSVIHCDWHCTQDLQHASNKRFKTYVASFGLLESTQALLHRALRVSHNNTLLDATEQHRMHTDDNRAVPLLFPNHAC